MRGSRRIGIVCPYSLDHHGGVQHHVLWLAEHLARQGDRVSVLAPGRPDRVPSDVMITSAGRAIPVPYNGSVARVNFGPRTAAGVRRWLHQGRFDLVHVHEPITPSIALHALAAATVPVVSTFHTATPRSRTMSIAGQVLAPLIRKIDAGIAVSESARQVVVQHLGRDAVVVPNGFEAERLRSADQPGRWRGGDRPRLTFLGRTDEPRKGLEVLLAGVGALRRERPDLDIVIAGRGRRGLPEGVRALGEVTEAEKVDLLGRTDVFVAPHLARESFGIVLLEALAAGAAVVATRLPAFVDLVTPLNTPNATLIPIGDPVALTAAVLGTLDRGRPGPPPGLRQFGWSAVGPQLEVAYRTALACGPQRLARERTDRRPERVWPELDRALRSRADWARSQGVRPASTRPDEPGQARERHESDLSEALRHSPSGRSAEQELAALARRLHNDVVATARQSRRSRTSDDLRSFEIAEG